MIVKRKSLGLYLLLVFTCSSLGLRCQDDKETSIAPPPSPSGVDVSFYLTKPDKSTLFARQETGVTIASDNNLTTIEVDKNTSFQEIDGFGFSLTGGSALHISNMSASNRLDLLTELFASDEENIGISYLRISLGASDLDGEVFSYNDLLPGETDENMEKFSLAQDKKYLIPVLKEILAINPEIKILASPWSPPTWMKTNGASKGGELKPEYYNAYAKYFVKYIQEMKKEGITIDAITVQNEPLHPGNNPSLYMPAEQQSYFVKNNLGPTFEAAGITTKIIIYDHNADRTDYPISILDDPETKKYVDGSAFHLYGGEIENLSLVHNAHPDKNLYFTEQWIGAPGDFAANLKWHVQNLIIGATRNWCKTVLEWNLAANSKLEPHTDGGCTECLGALTIDGNSVVRNPAYYIIAHASKFVRPGSVRIDSDQQNDLPNVAFETPDGSTVIIVLNNTEGEKSFNIKVGEEIITSSLPAGSVGTYVW